MPRTGANPFARGEWVSDDTSFINRETELREMARDLGDGEKLFLLAPRRYGKTSLIHMLLRRLERRQEVRTVFLDIGRSATYLQLLERFSTLVTRAGGTWDQLKETLTRFLQTVRPEVAFDEDGRPRFALGSSRVTDPHALAPDIFALPEIIAEKHDLRLVVAFDEFQLIDSFGGSTVESCLRSVIQGQRRVGYVFAGSQPSLMEAMLSPKRPFYRLGTRRFLGKISVADWEAFLPGPFAALGCHLGTPALRRLLALADEVPLDVQAIAHELWDRVRDTGLAQIQPQTVDETVDRMIEADSPIYERMWHQRPPHQRLVLQALAAGTAEGIYSTAARNRYGLSTPSTIRKALALLERVDIIEQRGKAYHFLEPLFAHWVRKKT